MPTTRPRYTITDTGEVGQMLDLAARRWPEISDRKELLVRLAAAGRTQVAEELARSDRDVRLQRQLAAIERIRERVDVDELLADAAWR